MDTQQIRDKSVKVAKDLGVEINSAFPILDGNMKIRGDEEIINRLLAINLVVSVSFGFDRLKGVSWLNQENLVGSLTPEEKQYTVDGIEPERPFKFQSRIESAWALAWVLGIVDNMDFTKPCADDFVKSFPDLKSGQSSIDFRLKVKRRTLLEIVEALDLAYCLHWAIQNNQLKGKESLGDMQKYSYIVIERRHAIEWLFSDEAWDDVPMDT